MIRGIDVSHYQGAVNWSTLKSRYGLSFAAAKCTEGTAYSDTEYTHNRAGAAAAGLPFIAYHYARPEASSALTQARRFVDTAGNVQGLCLDLEASSLSQSATNAWMRAFGDDLRSLAPGVTTFAYLGGYAANGSGQGSVDHFDHWWYPHYWGAQGSWPTTYDPRVGGNTTGWHVPPAPAIHQFSQDMGGMDANVSNLTIDQLFSGADMPLSQADADLVAKAVMDYQLGSSRAGVPAGTTYAFGNFISSIDVNAFKASGLTADAVASAVVKALPPSSTGGITKQDVTDAVKSVFAQAGA